MKRPLASLSILFICIVCSSIVVSTSIAGLCRSFFKDEVKNTNVKTAPVEKKQNEDFKQASVKL